MYWNFNVNTIKNSQDKKTDIRKKKSKNTSEEAMSLLVEKRIRQMAITILLDQPIKLVKNNLSVVLS